jgi:hypothetical protein
MSPGTSSVVGWLLEKRDPGVRYFALRNLMGAPADDPDVLAARRATLRASPVREILAAQDREGFWVKPGPGYSPKYTGTAWQVIFLGQFGADGRDRRVVKAANYVLDHSRSARGGFSATRTPMGMIHCLQGNLGASLLDLGLGDDPRLQQALDWLARSITGEGIAAADEVEADVRYLKSANCGPGFLCSANNRLPCAWGAVPALDALRRIPPRSRGGPARRAIDAGVDFLLSRDPARADYPMGYATKPSGSWFKFGYPLGYVGLGRGGDPRLQRTKELILSKRLPDGRWPLEYDYAGKTWFDLGAKKQPHKWVTLRALTVLQGMGETV